MGDQGGGKNQGCHQGRHVTVILLNCMEQNVGSLVRDRAAGPVDSHDDQTAGRQQIEEPGVGRPQGRHRVQAPGKGAAESTDHKADDDGKNHPPDPYPGVGQGQLYIRNTCKLLFFKPFFPLFYIILIPFLPSV